MFEFHIGKLLCLVKCNIALMFRGFKPLLTRFERAPLRAAGNAYGLYQAEKLVKGGRWNVVFRYQLWFPPLLT